MILWIVMAVLTVVASLSIVVPVYRGQRSDRSYGQAELSIYRDQLDEVERDLARGLIADNEADAARIEISRRLLRANDLAEGDTPRKGRSASQLVGVVAVVVVPLAALGLYLIVGNPELPDQPIAARLELPTQAQDISVLLSRVEAHLAANPDDARGWELLGPVYVRLGRYNDAAAAFSNTIRLLGPSPERESDMGEAITRASGNVVTPEARAAFERARALDPGAVRPRFYLALALEQDGRTGEAIAAWHELLQEAPEGAPWGAVARQALARLEGTAEPAESAGPETGPVAVRGPTAADVQAATGMNPDERMAMIGGMVDSLAARLDAEPDDADGWARLIRSYMVLGRTDEAAAALTRARSEFGGDGSKLAIVETEARSSGLIE
jgi:cytochrome c-type biogenesis protein CcmH